MSDLFLRGATDRFGQGNVKIEGVGDGGIYVSVSGLDSHATLAKAEAERLRDWLTEWLSAHKTGDISSDATTRQTKRRG